MKTAVFKEKKVYVSYVMESGLYALISYNPDFSAMFKVDVSELTELNFTIEKKKKEGDF